MVDFTHTHREMKLDWFRNNNDEQEEPLALLSVPQWFSRINEGFSYSIEGHTGLQQTIDVYFEEKTYSY